MLKSMSLKLLYIKGEQLSLKQKSKINFCFLEQLSLLKEGKKISNFFFPVIFILLHYDLDMADTFLFFTLCFKRQNRLINRFEKNFYWPSILDNKETSFLAIIFSYKVGEKKWKGDERCLIPLSYIKMKFLKIIFIAILSLSQFDRPG